MSYCKVSAVRGSFVFHQSWPFTHPRMPSLPQWGYFQPSRAGREWKDKCSICDRWRRRARLPHLPREGGLGSTACQTFTQTLSRSHSYRQTLHSHHWAFTWVNSVATAEPTEHFEEFKITKKLSAGHQTSRQYESCCGNCGTPGNPCHHACPSGLELAEHTRGLFSIRRLRLGCFTAGVPDKVKDHWSAEGKGWESDKEWHSLKMLKGFQGHSPQFQ